MAKKTGQAPLAFASVARKSGWMSVQAENDDTRTTYDSPLGRLSVRVAGHRITELNWGGFSNADSGPIAVQAMAQLREYFEGSRERFDLPLKLGRSPFQARFLQALIDIPFGHTRTYGDLAQDLGVSAQAIGQACGANPVPIIIPCHRVLAADGLGGFSGAGGVEAKVALLKHEGAASLLI